MWKRKAKQASDRWERYSFAKKDKMVLSYCLDEYGLSLFCFICPSDHSNSSQNHVQSVLFHAHPSAQDLPAAEPHPSVFPISFPLPFFLFIIPFLVPSAFHRHSISSFRIRPARCFPLPYPAAIRLYKTFPYMEFHSDHCICIISSDKDDPVSGSCFFRLSDHRPVRPL